MRRYLGPLIAAPLIFLVAKSRAGLFAGIFAGLSAFLITLFLGSLVRGRALRQAPPAPPLGADEKALLHGPVTFSGAQGPIEGWAYLSDRRLNLLAADSSDGVTIQLKEVQELRPDKRSFFRAGGTLGVVVGGQLWRLKVPDSARWQAQLQSAVRAKA